MSFEAIVKHYEKHFRPKAEVELSWFRDQVTLRQAIMVAARAEDHRGKRYSHQTRIRRAAIKNAERMLLVAQEEIEGSKSFDELFQLIRRTLNPIANIGELYVYDTALRIGAYLDRLPTVVYLHAGARDGAGAFGIKKGTKKLFRADLPPVFSALAPHEVEDVLCIYKDVLPNVVKGTAVELPDDPRCFPDLEDADF